jgi:hypothetical protein
LTTWSSRWLHSLPLNRLLSRHMHHQRSHRLNLLSHHLCNHREDQVVNHLGNRFRTHLCNHLLNQPGSPQQHQPVLPPNLQVIPACLRPEPPVRNPTVSLHHHRQCNHRARPQVILLSYPRHNRPAPHHQLRRHSHGERHRQSLLSNHCVILPYSLDPNRPHIRRQSHLHNHGLTHLHSLHICRLSSRPLARQVSPVVFPLLYRLYSRPRSLHVVPIQSHRDIRRCSHPQCPRYIRLYSLIASPPPNQSYFPPLLLQPSLYRLHQ